MKWQLDGRAENIEAVTERGTVLDGVLFANTDGEADTVVIAITGIHGNFYSNPFYFNFGDTLKAGGIHFVYAQVCDAFGEIRTRNVRTGSEEVIGSWNERFSYAAEDIRAYIDWAEGAGYRHIVLAGHSLGANKVIRYLAETHDSRVDRFLLLSPANVEYLTAEVTDEEKRIVSDMCESGRGSERLPFDLLGWIPCIADTAHDWLFSDTLNNVHVEADRDFSQVRAVSCSGALLIGTRDTFTYGGAHTCDRADVAERMGVRGWDWGVPPLARGRAFERNALHFSLRVCQRQTRGFRYRFIASFATPPNFSFQ